MAYKLGSLFDGSGGFPLAGSLCGIEPVWAAEVEPYPIAVTRSRFPNMKHLGDISKIKGAEVEPVDIITFGSPCQDLSVAGKRAGLKHEANGDEQTTRSGLFMEAVRIIREMREATNGAYPRFALWENVPGAFSSNKGEDFRIVLEELIKIVEPGASMPPVPKNGWPYADSYCGAGWSLAYRVFDAQHWGVPQRRRRIHLVLDLTAECAREVSFEREGVRGYFETGRTPWQSPSGDAENCSGATDREGVPYLVLQSVPNILLDDQGGQQINVRTDDKCPTLRAEAHGNVPAVVEQYLFENHSQDSRYKGPLDVAPMLPAQLGTGGNNQPFVVHRVALSIGNGQLNQISMSEVCNTLDCMHDKQAVIVFDKEAYNSGINATGAHYIREGGPSPALRTEHPSGVCVHYIVRRLTPTECARLQGFPDDWGHPNAKEDFTDEEYRFWLEVRNTHATVIGGKEVKDYTKAQMLTWYNKLHTDSAEYKMWGNGIALPPALYLLQGMADVLNRKKQERTEKIL